MQLLRRAATTRRPATTNTTCSTRSSLAQKPRFLSLFNYYELLSNIEYISLRFGVFHCLGKLFVLEFCGTRPHSSKNIRHVAQEPRVFVVSGPK